MHQLDINGNWLDFSLTGYDQWPADQSRYILFCDNHLCRSGLEITCLNPSWCYSHLKPGVKSHPLTYHISQSLSNLCCFDCRSNCKEACVVCLACAGWLRMGPLYNEEGPGLDWCRQLFSWDLWLRLLNRSGLEFSILYMSLQQTTILPCASGTM